MRKTILRVLTVAAALWSAASLSSASAQVNTNDCHNQIETRVDTSGGARTISSTVFVDIVNRQVAFTTDIVGQCVVVTFEATSACHGSNASNVCYIRILDNGVEMRPIGEGARVFDSNSSKAAHTVISIVRGNLSGTHTFRVQGRVGAAGTEFGLDDWLNKLDVFS